MTKFSFQVFFTLFHWLHPFFSWVFFSSRHTFPISSGRNQTICKTSTIIKGGRPSLIQFITFTFNFLIWHLFTPWSITFSTTNPTFLSLWLPLPQGISWRTHEDISISIKNSLPNHRTEEKSGYLEGGRRRAPILWRKRLRLRLPKCWQGPRQNQRQWWQEDSCFACKPIWMQG